MSVKSTQISVKAKKSRAARSTKQVNLDHVQRRLFNVLSRESLHLLDESYKGKLDRDDSVALSNYLKLMRDLKAQEENEMENISDEELEKLANVKR